MGKRRNGKREPRGTRRERETRSLQKKKKAKKEEETYPRRIQPLAESRSARELVLFLLPSLPTSTSTSALPFPLSLSPSFHPRPLWSSLSQTMLPPLLLLLLLSLTPSLATSPPLAKRFDLYTTLPNQANVLSAAAPTATTTTAAAASSPTSVLSTLTLPEFDANLPKSVNWAVWESADALVDVTRGNKLLSVQMKGNWLGYSVEMSVANQVCE